MKKYDIELYTICKNEEVLMNSFLEHYSKICSRINIYDNQSTDNTLNIIKEFKDKNDIDINIIEHNTNGYLRDDLYIQIKNTCWQNSNYDYVIIVDCDEFLNITNEDLYNENFDIIRTNGYEMVGDSNYVDDILYGKFDVNYSKCVMFSPKKIDSINYLLGAHVCNPIKKDNSAIEYSKKIYNLLHYKYINLEYVIKKYNENRKNMSNYNINNGLGIQYTWDINKIEEYYNNLKINSIKIK